MQRMWGVKKVFSFMFLALAIAVLLTACGGGGGGGSDGGGGNNNQTPPPNTNATITGTVAGTTVKVFDLSGNEVASNTATGNPKTFTLNVPAGGSYKFYLIENEGTANERVYALYQGTTNVFIIASAVTIDLGFVSTATGNAVPTNNPLNVPGVTSGGENATIPPSLMGGALLFTVTNNPSTGDDVAYRIARDSTYMYVAGWDSSPGNLQWRIEKRNLSDGALVAGFGAGGVITINPSAGEDMATGIAIDSTYMYVVGGDSSPGNSQWRIEKRNLSDGALAAGFGTGGVVTNDPSTAGDGIYGMAIDSTYMYVVGFDRIPGNLQWRIEKRNLSDGALAAGFGTGGVVTVNPGTTPGGFDDEARGIAIDSTYMYVVGNDGGSPNDLQWRIEKRNLSDGALAAGFGTGGVVNVNPSAAHEDAHEIAIDSTYMYVVGYDRSPGATDAQWRIEKRNLSDGALAAGFGTGGVVTNNPSTGDDGAFSIAIDSTYMYIVGDDYALGNYQWRIEKRNLSDGVLAAGFGTGGVITINPGTGDDMAVGIAIDSTYMYVVGEDSSLGNGQWRIEKRTKGSAFGLADLQGTWNYHMLTAGDASSSQTPGWEYGTITINGSGILNHTSVTRSNGNTTLPGSSTISITLSGIITISTDPLLHGVLSKDKNTLVMTNTTNGGPSGTGYVLGIAQKSGGTFSPSDLTGTWNYHQLWAGDPPGNNNGWEYGTAVIDDSGSTNVTCGAESAGSCGSFSTTLTIAATGVVSQTGNPDFYGVMSQDKSIIVGKAGRDSGTSYDLIIFQKFGAATFSQSDLTGAWNFQQLWAGDPPGNWNGWGYGPLVIDGSGNAILYCGADSDGNCSQSSAILTIDTTGVVSAAGGPNFHLMMSQDKSMVIGIDGGTNWFSMIIVMR